MITDKTIYNSEKDCPSCHTIARAGARFCPRCGGAFRQPRGADDKIQIYLETGDRIKEIAFKELQEADKILIQTANSTYRFAITDPARRRGLLSGGALHRELEEATLVGVLVANKHGFRSDMSALKTDSCALFFIKEGSGFKRLTTSLITNLVHIKEGEAPRPPLS